MPQTSASVQITRKKLSSFPKAFSSCTVEGKAYAKCVLMKENLTKGICAAEFATFWSCMTKSPRKNRFIVMATPLNKRLLNVKEGNADNTSLPGTFPQFFEDLPVFPQMPDFSTHPASDAFAKVMMGTINRDNVDEIEELQTQMLTRFEKTNEMLLNFNALSSARYEATQVEFAKHTALLSTMKSDLDDIFKRIRRIKNHIRAKHPKAFSTCVVKFDVPEEEDETIKSPIATNNVASSLPNVYMPECVPKTIDEPTEASKIQLSDESANKEDENNSVPSSGVTDVCVTEEEKVASS